MTEAINSTVQTVTIDNQPYPLASLTEQARAQIVNLQAVEAEIAQLQRQLAIAQTARAAYAGILKAEIAKLA
jgi:hypothetical protein